MNVRKNVFFIIVATLCVAAITLYIAFGELPLPGASKAQQSVNTGNATIGAESVWISEAMASNPGIIPDNKGDFPDWIELYNSGDEEFDLSAYGLSDTQEEVKWIFPNGFTIKPKSYLLIYCSGINDTDGDIIHVDFKLKAGNGKESVVMTNASGQAVDILALPEISEGYSIGRLSDNPGKWSEFEKPTPGFENSEEGRAAYDASMITQDYSIIVNEIQPCNESLFAGEKGDYPDWIELLNTGSESVDLSGFGLSDNRDRPLKWTFPNGSRIDPGEYLLVFADGTIDQIGEFESVYANFRLDNYKESVVLTDKIGRVIDAVDYEGIPADASLGRIEGTDEWEVFVHPTPGYINDESGYEEFTKSLQQLLSSDLYISEIMLSNSSYAEDNEEFYDWIELHNAGAGAVDLSGYALSDDAGNPGRWQFPDNTIINPGEYKVLMASGTPIADAKKKSENYIHLNFNLSNEKGEIVTLYDAEGLLIDRIAATTQKREASYGRSGPGQAFQHYPQPTPGAANSQGYRTYAGSPEIKLAAGFYSGAQSVAVELPSQGQGLTLRYTLDGSEPTENSSVYQSAVQIDKTTVLRVRSFSDDPAVLASDISTSSYFINSPHSEALSIVSISTDADNFFDKETGIYVLGPNYPNGYQEGDFPYSKANFWQEKEVPVHVEIFDGGGKNQISQEAAVRIFGAYSRGLQQKGLALIARSQYGKNSFNYPIFENREYNQYKSLTLRASGQDATVTKLHDIVATSLVDGTTNIEVQAYRQAVVYLNGEYFGIYNIREKVSKHWVAAHYGIKDPDNIDLLVANGKPQNALVGDNVAYQELLDYCENNDLSKNEHYEHVATLMDIDNYIDYLIAEMYIANTDTGNIKFFRERSDDPEKSKFRWIYYDFCWSMISTKMDSFEFLTNPQGHGVGKGFSTLLTRSLMKNQDFRNQFLRRFAELLKTVYAPENVLSRIEECEARIYDEMERDIERWPETEKGRGNFSVWKSNVRHAKEFAANRPDYCIGFLREHFSLSESQAKRIFGSAGIMTGTSRASSDSSSAEGSKANTDEGVIERVEIDEEGND